MLVTNEDAKLVRSDRNKNCIKVTAETDPLYFYSIQSFMNDCHFDNITNVSRAKIWNVNFLTRQYFLKNWSVYLYL